MATGTTEALPSKHWHGVAAEIKNSLEQIQSNMAKFKLGSTKDEESVNAKQRQHADIRLKYIMAQAKQKFLTLLCKEDILHGKESVEKFESKVLEAQLRHRETSQQQLKIAQESNDKKAELRNDVALTVAKLDSICGQIEVLDKENARCSNKSASAVLQKQLKSGEEEIAKLKQEKELHQSKLLEHEATRQKLRRQLAALKNSQEEHTAVDSTSTTSSHSMTSSSIDQKNMTRWYQELNAYLNRATGISVNQSNFSRSATDGCRRLKLTLFNSHIMDIGFAPTGGIATIQLSPDNIYHDDIDEATLTSETELEQSRLRWAVSEYCRRVSRAGRLRKACQNISNQERYFVSFDAVKGRIVLTLKKEAHSDITLTCESSRMFVKRVDAIAPIELQSEDFSEEEKQSFLEKIKKQGPFNNIGGVATQLSCLMDAV